MMWIEVLSRSHEVLSRHRIDGDKATVGRGYDNDLIIDDPLVAADHLLITRNAEAQFEALNKSGLSGGLVDVARPRAKKQERLTLTGESIIRIGNTWLRVREPGFPVPPVSKPERRLWPLALVLFPLLQALGMLVVWLRLTNDSNLFAVYASQLLQINTITLVWALFWTVLCRVFGGRARFFAHLCVAMTGALLLTIESLFAEWLIYGFSLRGFAHYHYIINLAIVGALCYIHMRLMGPTHRKQKAAISLGVFAALTAISLIMNYDENAGDPPYLSRLLPPSFIMIAPQSETDFMSRLDELREQAERDRKKAVHSDDDLEEFDGDTE